jgi:hypothetical protein
MISLNEFFNSVQVLAVLMIIALSLYFGLVERKFHIPPDLVVERVRDSLKASRGEDLQIEEPITCGQSPPPRLPHHSSRYAWPDVDTAPGCTGARVPSETPVDESIEHTDLGATPPELHPAEPGNWGTSGGIRSLTRGSVS